MSHWSGALAVCIACLVALGRTPTARAQPVDCGLVGCEYCQTPRIFRKCTAFCVSACGYATDYQPPKHRAPPGRRMPDFQVATTTTRRPPGPTTPRRDKLEDVLAEILPGPSPAQKAAAKAAAAAAAAAESEDTGYHFDFPKVNFKTNRDRLPLPVQDILNGRRPRKYSTLAPPTTPRVRRTRPPKTPKPSTERKANRSNRRRDSEDYSEWRSSGDSQSSTEERTSSESSQQSKYDSDSSRSSSYDSDGSDSSHGSDSSDNSATSTKSDSSDDSDSSAESDSSDESDDDSNRSRSRTKTNRRNRKEERLAQKGRTTTTATTTTTKPYQRAAAKPVNNPMQPRPRPALTDRLVAMPQTERPQRVVVTRAPATTKRTFPTKQTDAPATSRRPRPTTTATRRPTTATRRPTTTTRRPTTTSTTRRPTTTSTTQRQTTTPTPTTKTAAVQHNQCPQQPGWKPCLSKEEANVRFRACCEPLGTACADLCHYDMTQQSLQIAALTGACPVSSIETLMSCGSQSNDVSACCEAKGVFLGTRSVCRPFCNPSKGLPTGPDPRYFQCLGQLASIQACFWAYLK